MKAIQIKLPASLENLTLVDMAEPSQPGPDMGNGAVTDALNPAWLVAWRERGPTPPSQHEPHPCQGGGDGETAPVSAVAKAARPQRPKPNVQGFVEPLP